MGRGFTPGLTITSNALLRRRRELPIPGKVLVKVGDEVTSTTVVARAELPGELRIVRIAQQLGIEPSDVMQSLRVKIGDSIEKEAVLCEHRGLFGLIRSIAKSPIGGTVELIIEGTGHVGIRGPSVALNLPAYVSGRIAEVDPAKGVTVECAAAFVQGIFGIGGEQNGTLELLQIPGDKAVVPGDIPEHCGGKVLVGGCSPSAETLRTAMERGAVGFVTGSIDDKALGTFLGYDLGIALTGDEDIAMTVIITEGFGHLAISDKVLKCLGGRNGASCSLNGATQVRAGAVRPEIIIPLQEPSTRNETSTETDGELRVSLPVRITRVPYFGETGTVCELPHDPERIATGALTRVVRVAMDNGKTITVPRANVERMDIA